VISCFSFFSKDILKLEQLALDGDAVLRRGEETEEEEEARSEGEAGAEAVNIGAWEGERVISRLVSD
jgi:hypothetical protein